MSKINTASYPDFVRNAKVMWRDGYENVPLVAKQMYDVRMSDELVTEHSSMDDFGFARELTESDNYYEDTPTQNYSKTMTKYRIGLKATITWNMRKYDKYREIQKKLNGLGRRVSLRMELDLTHRFTFGTATTYVNMDGRTVSISVGDGRALFDTAHTVTGSSTTYRNRVANNPAFSKGGLEAAQQLFATQMIDSTGIKVTVNPDTIVTHNDPQTMNNVAQYLNSVADPEGAHSGVVNNYRSKFRHVVLPYLASTNTGARDSTKEKYWMLAALAHTDALCEISEMPHMVSPSVGSNAEEFDNDDWKFKASAAYGIEIVDPKWIVLSSGDGTA